MAELETLAKNNVGSGSGPQNSSHKSTQNLLGGGVATSGIEDRIMSPANVACPDCSKTYQILNPLEGLVYQCQQCQSQFMLRKEGATPRMQAFRWSEDQILKILFEIPGERSQTQLSRAWRNVFDSLDDVKAHENFIFLCRQKNNLNLAREKYKQLAIYLNWTALPEHLRLILEPPQVKVSPWIERMPWILLGFAILLMLLGSVLPGQRNMIGAGVLVVIIDFLIFRKRFKFLH